MPVEESFWNPYRFVPVQPGPPPKKRPNYHHQLAGLSGVLHCRLQAMTALLVASQTQQVRKFWQAQATRQPAIPGTSLKGMLRSVAELVGHGCAVTDDGQSCKKSSQLCITCRLFGFVKGGEHYKGHVSIGDAAWDPASCTPHHKWATYDIYLSNPQKRHRAFYKGSSRHFRKRYHHQPKQRERPSGTGGAPPNAKAALTTKAAPAPAGAEFQFEVQFSGLDDELLSLLLYSLCLEDHSEAEICGWDEDVRLKKLLRIQGPLCHKLGHGRPIGLGSCRIQVEGAFVGSPRARYAVSGTVRRRQALASDEIKTWIQEKTSSYRELETPTLRAFRKMAIFDQQDPRVFRYPSWSWFKESGNSHVELKPLLHET